MQVDVFVSGVMRDGKHTQMLVFPHGSTSAIPEHLRNIEWRFFSTTESDDHLLGLAAGEVEIEMTDHGYVLVTPEIARY